MRVDLTRDPVSAKRTTVWERKKAYVRPVETPAAERIRARLRPSLFTRVTDRLFERYEQLDSRFEAYQDRKKNWLEKYWGAIAGISVLFIAFLYEGQPGHAAQFFGTFALLAFTVRAYYGWHKRNLVSPPHLITFREEAIALAHAVVGASVIFMAQWAISSSFKNPRLDLLDAVVGSVVLGAGVFKLRTTEQSEKEERQHQSIAGILFFLVVIYGIYAVG